MEPNIQTTTPTTRKSYKKHILVIVIGIVVIALIAVAVVVGIPVLQKNGVISQVKDDLNKVVPVMAAKKTATGAYPNTITDVLALSTDKVALTGSSSFDGTSYCITGTSKSDKSIVYHINSAKSSDGPQSGSCETGSDLPKPVTPGDMAVAFTSSTEAKITWATATYATSYVLQCSIDNIFSSPVIVNATDTFGTCDKLKSNTTYYSRVKAINKTGESAWSLVLTIKTN